MQMIDDIKPPLQHEPPRETPPKNGSDERNGSFFAELFKFALIAIFIVLPFRLFVAQPFIVKGASMDPTFENGDYLIVDQLTLKFEEPQRGMPIIFKFPEDTSKYFIKRVIGLPGETVIVRGSAVTIKNAEHPEGFMLDEPYVKFLKPDDDVTATLSAGEYFVMGDNRAGSYDSRAWGPVPAGDIVGRPLLRLFPLNELGILPGQASLHESADSSK